VLVCVFRCRCRWVCFFGCVCVGDPYALEPQRVEERSPPQISRVWVAAVSAARQVSLKRALLVAWVGNDYPSGSLRVSTNSPGGV